MTLWIDGDSCHRKAMEIVFRTVGRNGLILHIAADRPIPGADEVGATTTILEHGSGRVDRYLIDNSAPGDIAVTRDLDLGLRLMERGVTVMNDRGRVWTSKALRNRLEEANIMNAMRAGGIAGKGTSSYDGDDAHRFAESLDHLLAGSARAR